MGAQITLDHHERWDGSGYPQGKRGDEISLAARVMSICDIYDALRNVHPYKLAMAHQRAVEIINQGDPSQFGVTKLRITAALKCSEGPLLWRALLFVFQSHVEDYHV